MNKNSLCRICIGVLAESLSSLALFTTLDDNTLAVCLSVLVGIIYSLASRPSSGAYAGQIMTAAALLGVRQVDDSS